MADLKEPEVEAKVSRATRVSASGRTTVFVDMQPDGSYVLTVTRDGRTIHNFSDNAEQAGVDG